MDTRTWIRIGLSVLPFIGCIVGSVVGIAYGWVFSELFKALLQSSPPASYGYIDSILALPPRPMLRIGLLRSTHSCSSASAGLPVSS